MILLLFLLLLLHSHTNLTKIRVPHLLYLVIIPALSYLVKLALVMGCGGSKIDDNNHQNQALIKLCRERKHLLKSAADNRFALAAAHVAYFGQLSAVGDTLWRFVEEELVLLTSSTPSSTPSSISSVSSPVITIPSDDFKKSKKKTSKEAKDFRGKGGVGDDVEGDHDHNSHLNWSDSEDESSMRGIETKNDEIHEGLRSRESPKPGISYIPDHTYGYPNYYPSMPNYYDNVNVNDSSYVDLGFNSYSNYPEYSGGNYASSSSYYNGGSYNYNDSGNGNGNTTSYTSYYMKKSSTRIPSVIYEEPKNVNNPIYSFSDNQGYGDSGSSSYQNVVNHRQEQERERERKPQKVRPPPTPPQPNVSAWDYFNPFESFESVGGGGSVYSGIQQPGIYGYGNGYESNSSSPDSREVREREGIPDLEEETETEVSYPSSSTKIAGPQKGGKSVSFRDHVDDIPVRNKGKRNKYNNNVQNASNFDEGTSRRMPFVEQEPELEVVDEEREVEGSNISPETEASVTTISTSGEEHEHEHEHVLQHGFEEEREKERVYVKKKGVSFEVEGGGGSSHEVQSSMPSSLTTLSADGTRDLREVVQEIKDEFEAATDYGKEVSTLLEVGREPYRSRSTFLKVMLAKVCSTSLPSTHSSSGLDTGYPEELDSRSLASTLDKLYVWEKKLYKEVKDEERLRLMYEKQCKKLKSLDEQGAESGKVEAAQFSIRKLLTQINVSVRAVDSISSRIHKLRDEELQPQLKELIYGLRKMWKLMLKCHQKQFQAILASKTRALRANTGLRKDSSVRATIQLEAELLKWCQRFNNWIEMQRSYAETLNSWLERCIQYEPEVTSDGVMPFSPGRIGAPPVFVICHDWKQAMERVSESEVQTAMNDFATSLHQLWERQDEEQRRRLKAENMYKDFEKQIRATRVDRTRKGRDDDGAFSDKNSLSIVASDSGISPLDDLKVDLDSMRQRVREERAGHKEAVKLVHDAVSRSIQAGLIPIFESLESFTSEASKALDDVRLEHVSVRS